MSLDPSLLLLRARAVGALADIEKAAKKAGKFDSVKHPRYPAGNPKGGQFRPKLGTGAGGAEIFMPVYTGSNKIIQSFEAATLAVANQMAQGILTGAQKLLGVKTHPDDTNNLKLKSTVRQLAAGVAKPDLPDIFAKPDAVPDAVATPTVKPAAVIQSVQPKAVTGTTAHDVGAYANGEFKNGVQSIKTDELDAMVYRAAGGDGAAILGFDPKEHGEASVVANGMIKNAQSGQINDLLLTPVVGYPVSAQLDALKTRLMAAVGLEKEYGKFQSDWQSQYGDLPIAVKANYNIEIPLTVDEIKAGSSMLIAAAQGKIKTVVETPTEGNPFKESAKSKIMAVLVPPVGQAQSASFDLKPFPNYNTTWSKSTQHQYAQKMSDIKTAADAGDMATLNAISVSDLPIGTPGQKHFQSQVDAAKIFVQSKQGAVQPDATPAPVAATPALPVKPKVATNSANEYFVDKVESLGQKGLSGLPIDRLIATQSLGSYLKSGSPQVVAYAQSWIDHLNANGTPAAVPPTMKPVLAMTPAAVKPVATPIAALPVKPDTTGNWPATAQIKHVDNVVNGKGYKQEAALLNLNNFLLSATATPEGKQYAQAWIDHLKAGGTATPVATPKPTPAPVVTATATAAVISAPKGIGSKTHQQYTKQGDAVYQSALAGDKAAVDAMVAQYQAKIDAAQLKPNYPTFADGQYHKLLAYSQKVQAEMQTAATAGLPATAPKSALTKTKLALAGMTLVGGKPGGSNPGGIYQDADGAKWLVKGSNQPDPDGGPAKNEVLAARLYNAAGGYAPEMRTVDLGTQYGGGIGVASKMQDGFKALDVNNPAHVAKAREDFALDAWMANWDSVGLAMDNTVIDQNGNALRIDPGGALLYRAQGTPKGAEFGKTVGEWNSLRDPSKNPQAAKVFAGMTDSELKASAAKVAAISDDTIQALVDRFGPGDAAAKAQLADTLIARKQDVIAKAGLIGATAAVAAATPVKPAAKTATTPPVKPDTSALTALQKAVFAIIDNAVTKAGAYSSLTDQDIQGVLGVLASSTASALSSSPQSKQYAQAWLDHLNAGGAAATTTAAATATVKPAAAPTVVLAVKPALPNFSDYKLEAGNSNASGVNAKVDKIAALAQAGDVAGILALSYGSNTYAKKTVNLANDTLAALGSTATVTAGQKANSHPGIGTAGTAPVKPTAATPLPVTASHTGTWANQYGAGVGDLTTRVTALGATVAAKAHFDPAKLDTPPDYANFHGPGKGLSSKAEKNAVSNQIAQELYVLAANGDLVALKNYDIAAQVGGVKGTTTESVVGAYRDLLIGQIDNMLNPPKPVQTWKIGGPVTPDNVAQTLQQAFPKYQQYQQTFQNKAQMLGRWGIQGGLESKSLSKIVAAAKAIPAKSFKKSSPELQTIYDESQAKYNALQSHEQNAIKSYTGGIYKTWNTQIATNQLSDPVKIGMRAYEKASVELPPGLILSRKWDAPNALYTQIMQGLPQLEGKIVQDFAMISTSINPKVWHGEVQMRIKTLPGARGLYVDSTDKSGLAISVNAGEREIVLNSKTRFLVTKVSKTNYDTKFFQSDGTIFMDVLALPEDPAGSVLDSLGGS